MKRLTVLVVNWWMIGILMSAAAWIMLWEMTG